MLTHFVTNWASPVFQDNIVFEYNKKIYILDKKIVECTQEIFRYLENPVQMDKKVTLSKLAVLFINPQEINTIFNFFHSGQIFSLVGREAIQALSGKTAFFGLSLLDTYLQIRNTGKKSMQIAEVFLDDQLALYALQQNCKGFGKTLVHLQDVWQNIDLSTVAHFQPTHFETLMVEWIRPHNSMLYASLIEEYCIRRWISLESDLPFFKDQKLKFDCLAACPLLDRRIQWFDMFWKKMSIDLIRKEVIQPLINKQKLLEAKAWVLKTKDTVSAKQLAEEFDKTKSHEVKDLLPLLDKQDWIPHSEEDDEIIVINSLLQLQSSCSSTRIIQTCADRYFCEYMESKNPLVKTFKEILTTCFEGDKSLIWHRGLISLIIYSFIRAAVKYANEKIVKNFTKASVDFQPHEAYLHPSLPSCCEVIENLKESLQDIFLKEFERDKNEETPVILDELELLSFIQLIARQCYSQTFSLSNDFIVQFVSNQWLINRERDQSKPLIQALEEALKEAEFGDLSQAQIELAFFTYLRVAAETVNLQFIFQQQQRLDIYNIKHSHMYWIVNLLQTISPKLHEDFPEEIMQKQAPAIAKILRSNPELKRALMIRSLQTLYTVKPREQAICPPFFPGQTLHLPKNNYLLVGDDSIQ